MLRSVCLGPVCASSIINIIIIIDINIIVSIIIIIIKIICSIIIIFGGLTRSALTGLTRSAFIKGLHEHVFKRPWHTWPASRIRVQGHLPSLGR